ncbi:DUF938 domain-containing protein [Synechococcus elongatus]|uniref:DUF938 domain-containing protein n=1 Tax=Synechococcus elongatus PCC 11801 TaxID=2219813 RepID=A0AAN1QMN4_SYNEL|nr:DUF938 domain-containing protein [Synechococcus elongatus]AZB71904.1 SAM-dependent methyltransferase [Synechococcus elongatus PCC 11801]
MDDRLYAPATERNRDVILAVLKDELRLPGTVLEIASGTGEHAAYFAPQLPDYFWQPSDPTQESRRSINAWRSHVNAPNLGKAIAIDVTQPDWTESLPVLPQPIVAIAAINLIHISPWEATLGLFSGARQLLSPDGLIYLYGAYKRNGEHTAPSNEAFDASLKARNLSWGVRNLEDVIQVAEAEQFRLDRVIEMPSNNLSVCFRAIV